MEEAVLEGLGGVVEEVSGVFKMLNEGDLWRGDMGVAYAALSPLS